MARCRASKAGLADAGRASRRCSASLPEPNAAGPRQALHDDRHRRRRHRRRHHLGRARPGRPSRRQGFRRDRHDRPRAEGRRGCLPHEGGAQRPTTSTPSAPASPVADLVIGCDLVVTASNKVLETIKPDHTTVVLSDHEMPVADFARNPDLKLPGGDLQARRSRSACARAALHALDAHDLRRASCSRDSIASNMFMLGYAYQLGAVPVGAELDREGDRAQRRGHRDEPQCLPVRPACRARPRSARPAREARASDKRAARRSTTIVALRAEHLDRLSGRGAGRSLSRARRAHRSAREGQGAGPLRSRRSGRARLLQAARLQGRVRGGAALHRRSLREGRSTSTSTATSGSSSIWRRRCCPGSTATR